MTAPGKRLGGRARGVKNKPRPITPKQALFVAKYLETSDLRRSAIAAGYKEEHAAARASRLIHHTPAVKAAVDKARNAVVRKGEYNLERLMDELNEGMDFARETGNATALARFTELKAKAMGLLIERIDQRQVGSFEINISGIDKPKAPEVIDITPSEENDIFK